MNIILKKHIFAYLFVVLLSFHCSYVIASGNSKKPAVHAVNQLKIYGHQTYHNENGQPKPNPPGEGDYAIYYGALQLAYFDFKLWAHPNHYQFYEWWLEPLYGPWGELHHGDPIQKYSSRIPYYDMPKGPLKPVHDTITLTAWNLFGAKHTVKYKVTFHNPVENYHEDISKVPIDSPRDFKPEKTEPEKVNENGGTMYVTTKYWGKFYAPAMIALGQGYEIWEVAELGEYCEVFAVAPQWAVVMTVIGFAGEKVKEDSEVKIPVNFSDVFLSGLSRKVTSDGGELSGNKYEPEVKIGPGETWQQVAATYSMESPRKRIVYKKHYYKYEKYDVHDGFKGIANDTQDIFEKGGKIYYVATFSENTGE